MARGNCCDIFGGKMVFFQCSWSSSVLGDCVESIRKYECMNAKRNVYVQYAPIVIYIYK